MVLLGGLELVAAGYLISKHQENKKAKQRILEDAAELEERRYHNVSSDDGRSRPERRRHRSHSRRRHSIDRKDSYDGGHSHDGKYRRESPRPKPRPTPVPQAVRPPMAAPQAMRPPAFIPAPIPQASSRPPAFMAAPPSQPPPQDMKYGWTDGGPAQRPQQAEPPTGWPSHWPQSHTPDPAAGPSNFAPAQSRRRESSRGRSPRRPSSTPPRVRFAPTERSLSRSPPPSYRP